VENLEKTDRKEIREMLERMTDEQLTELIADLDAQELCGQMTRLHSEFLKAQCIVLNVAWGKDAIKHAVKNS